jgi:putative membrane protein
VSEAAGHAPGEWRRTSPLSFLVRAITGLKNLIFPAVAMLFGTQGWDGGGAFVIPAIAGMVLISSVFTYIAWRHFRYRIGEDDIRVERGLFNRTARSVPYERIQDVSLEQAPVPRLFGMAEVKFETGAGGKDELKIGYVTEAEGAALRETVRARKSGEAPGRVEAEETEARTLFAMDARRLATFGLFEFSLVVFAVLGGAAQQFEPLLPFDIWDYRRWVELVAGPQHWLRELGIAAQAIGAMLALAALGVVGLATGIGRTVLRDYGFRLEETPKGLRRRRGLLTRTDVVMPIHRVQALQVTTGIVRRRWGWHGLSVVSLAQDARAANHVVVPFARMDEVEPVVDVTGFDLPAGETEWRKPSAKHRLDQALLCAIPFGVAALAVPIVNAQSGQPLELPLLVSAALLALAGFFAVREHFLWRRDRHAIDARHIFVRRGWLSPRLDIASRVKLQSVEIAQGPLARRRGYANLKFGVAGGSLELAGIPLDDARQIRQAVLDSIASVDFSRLP